MIFTLDILFHTLVAIGFTSGMFYFTQALIPWSWIAVPVCVAAFYVREASQKDWRFTDWKLKKHMEWVVPTVMSVVTGLFWSWFLAQ